MKLAITSKQTTARGRLGPVCIACSNTQRFWVHCDDGEHLVEMYSLPEGEVRIIACGRCRSRHSIVITHLD